MLIGTRFLANSFLESKIQPMKNSIIIWIIKLIAVVILLQTLYFKFTGAEESVYIFSTLGIEPYGRIGSGVIELIASVLILIPRTTLLGALLGAGTMLGAIASHVLILGIEVKNDGGTLFILAIITFLCCAVLVFREMHKIPQLLRLKL
jgi:uncharacterized membrane protein YphA (DoxX/SURF4 family)